MSALLYCRQCKRYHEWERHMVEAISDTVMLEICDNVGLGPEADTVTRISMCAGRVHLGMWWSTDPERTGEVASMFTPADARKVAAALVRAADMVEEVRCCVSLHPGSRATGIQCSLVRGHSGPHKFNREEG